MHYHMIAMWAGFVLDLLLGDPHWLPHPICIIGNGISMLTKQLLGEKGEEKHTENPRVQRRRGLLLVVLILLGTLLVSGGILLGAYWIHPIAGCVVESIMTYQILATKCLKVESMKVYERLQAGDLEGARYAVSMIVGRDTSVLDEVGVAKAAIETVAENTSDGIIAPMLYTALGGPILGFLYKAINTMDSMVGYRNDRYLNFGRYAAKLDDVVNYLPARISAYLMIVSAFLLGKEFDGRKAYAIYRRDRYQHASPNSAQTESACAGALSIQLAGNAVYFGKLVEKPYIGDAIRPVSYEDIRRANQLLYMSAILCMLVISCIMAGILVGQI